MALPAATAFTGSSITEAQFKTAMADLRDYLAGLLGDAGTTPDAQAALDVIFGAGVDAKTGAYTLSTGDRGKLLDCTGTWTLSLMTASTAGAGFCVALRNSGTGIITIDPAGAELIDGESTIAIAASSSVIMVCIGSAWVTVGKIDANAFVKKDHGHNVVGSMCLAGRSVAASSVYKNPGDTDSGSNLYPATGYGYGGASLHATALSGTWRCLGYMYGTNPYGATNTATLWQRIA